MSFDTADVCYYMCEAAGAQGNETVIPHDATTLLCGFINASVFIGPAWQDVMPIPAFQQQAALFFKVRCAWAFIRGELGLKRALPMSFFIVCVIYVRAY